MKGESRTPYVLMGIGVTAMLAFGVTGAIIFNQRKRQASFDYLMQVIKDNKPSDAAFSGKGSPFDLSLYIGNPSGAKIPAIDAKAMAEKIYKADGYFTNDKTAIESVFKNVSNKYDVSAIANAFYQEYNKTDLYAYLKKMLNDSDMNTYVLSYTKKLN